MSSQFNDIERMFSEGLQNYEVTPPAHVWTNIQKAKRRGIFYYLANNKLKVASILLLLLAGSSVFYFNSQNELTSKSESLVKTPDVVNTPEVVEQNNVNENIAPSLRNEANEKNNVSTNAEVSKSITIVKKSSRKIIQRPVVNPIVIEKAEETVPKAPEELNSEIYIADEMFMNLSSKKIRFKYLIYPALSQYVYSTKTKFKKPYKPTVKDKNNDNDQPTTRYSFELVGGPSFATRKLSGSNYDLRNESEKALLSTQTGIKFNYHFNPTWSLQTGFISENRSENVKYNRTEIQNKLVLSQHDVIIYHPVLPPRHVTVIDSSYADQNVEFKFNATNKYTSLNIPLMLGYNFTLGKFQYRISGGTLLNIYSLNAANNLVRKGNDIVLESYKEKSGIKTSYYGALGMFFPVNQNLSFITELSYYRNTANRLTSESSIKQINYGLNFSGGIKFNIIK